MQQVIFDADDPIETHLIKHAENAYFYLFLLIKEYWVMDRKFG